MDLMRKGSHGSAVADLQRALNLHGAALQADGWFGEATEQAVTAAQRRAGLVMDGVAGPKTLAALRGIAQPTRLKEADLVTAAAQLDVSLACVKAVNAVESRGSGFLDDGRVVILLERHVAHRRAKAAGLDVTSLAQRYPNLVNPARGGYAGGAAEWGRFDNLRRVTTAAIAVEACSWGLFQVIGYHWETLGYTSAAEFQTRMASGEGAQLEAFVRFVAADTVLLKALRARRWADFARLYNGPAYKENAYDARLSAAYAKAERLAA